MSLTHLLASWQSLVGKFVVDGCDPCKAKNFHAFFPQTFYPINAGKWVSGTQNTGIHYSGNSSIFVFQVSAVVK
jgi:hypothetical protein